MNSENNKFILGAHYYLPGFTEHDDWYADLINMRDTGITCVQAVAAWNWIHVAPNEFDFDELHQFTNMAAEIGLEVQIGMVLESAPEWVVESNSNWMYVDQKDKCLHPYAKTRYQYGGWPGMCFDHDEARELASRFVTALGKFAEAESAVTSIEAWSGVTFPPAFHAPVKEERFCYCSATKAAFVEWLKQKHNNNVEDLNKAWKRKFTDWSQVTPPRFFGTFPDELDWCRFMYERQKLMLKWKVKQLRDSGFTGLLTAHTGLDHALQPQLACDDHACAAMVDEWGFTNAQVVEGKKNAYFLFFGADFARSAARGKPFRLSQLRVGPFASQTMQKESGHSAEFVRLNNWTSIAGSVNRIFYRSWRPQTSGHEAEGYGLTTLAGELNDRTNAVRRVADLVKKYPQIVSFVPVPGDISILLLPESANFNYVTENGSAKYYDKAIKGAYKAFFDNNISVDFIRIDQLKDKKVVYMPWPLLLSENDILQIACFVKEGGTLVSEACPGKFNYSGFRNTSVPPGVLKEIFGCIEDDVAEMIIDAKTAPVIAGKNKHYPCANIQSFLQPTTGTPIGKYLTNEVAVVDNNYGKGKARLIGTNPSICYFDTDDARAADLICASMPYAGLTPLIKTNASAVHSRWLSGNESDLLIMVNLTNVPAMAGMETEWDREKYSYVHDWLTGEKTKIKKMTNEFTIPSHEMRIIEFFKK